MGTPRPSSRPGSKRQGPLAPRLLISGEDAVLLGSMERIVLWSRPGWTVEAVVGVEPTRRALRERAFDVLVATVEPRSSAGSAVLKVARLSHPGVRRVTYRTSPACDGQEVRMANEIVAHPADHQALLAALDRALAGGEPRPSSPVLEAAPLPPTGS